MNAAEEAEEYEAPVDFGDVHSGMASGDNTPASAPVFLSDHDKSATKSARFSKNPSSGKASKSNAAAADGNSLHSSPQFLQTSRNSTPQRIIRRDLERKLRYRSNRDRSESRPIKRNDIPYNNNNATNDNNQVQTAAGAAPLPKALTDLLLQTAILGIDTTAKLSKPTLALTKNTLLPQIILPLLTELWETYAPDRLQTWMKVVPSSLQNLYGLLWETEAGKQFGTSSLQLGGDVLDMMSSDVARQCCIDVTVTLIKVLDALHTPEVRAVLDQFAVSMCRLVDVVSSGKAKQVWFDVSDTIWAALEVGSDDVMVMALAEGCAKVCFALERERESLKRRKRGGEVVLGGKSSGKVKTERLIVAARRRKERDQRQMEAYPPGKEVLRGEGGRCDIEDALMDGLGGFARDENQQPEEDDADQIYMNMSSVVIDNNDRPPQKVIVPTSSMEDMSQSRTDPNIVADREDDESEITTEIEDLGVRRNDGVVESSIDLRQQSNVSVERQQEGALFYEDEQDNHLDDNDNDVDEEQDEASETYDNFDESVLQFYRRLNDVLTQTRKEVKLREALDTKHYDASRQRAECLERPNDDTSSEPADKETDAAQSAIPSNYGIGLFSISKKWWKLLLVAFICGTFTMCLLWVALGCYGFYVIFIADANLPIPPAQVMQPPPIVIQIASMTSRGVNNECNSEPEQSEFRDVTSISLDDWKELTQDINAAIEQATQSE